MSRRTRRDFLAAAATVPLAAPVLRGTGQEPAAAPAARPLRMLILGGTAFVGPHVVEAALARGHQVTLFNRGRTNNNLFPQLEKLRGDRDPDKGEGLKALEGREWDVVVDTSAYVPRIAGASAALLAPNVGHYLFVSTLSVYADRTVDVDETAPVGVLDDPGVEQVTGATYGPLKALCEQAVEAAMPGRVLNLRPGLIVGPLDRTDRFTWWPVRVARGGDVMAPGRPDAPVQFIDVRDLAAFCVRGLEDRVSGVFNGIGPPAGLTMQEFLHGCKVVCGSDARFTWIDDDFLVASGVRAYTEVPLWIPREGPPYGTAQGAKAAAAGLAFRPAGDTIRDTLAWADSRPADHRWRGGLVPAKEAELLASWRAR